MEASLLSASAGEITYLRNLIERMSCLTETVEGIVL